jgi:hypothetical protein
VVFHSLSWLTAYHMRGVGIIRVLWFDTVCLTDGRGYRMEAWAWSEKRMT